MTAYDIIAFLLGLVGLAMNYTSMLLTFPGKRGLRFTVCVLVLFAALFYAANFFFGSIVPKDNLITGLAYLPIMLWLFRGKAFQITFAFFFQFFALLLQVSLARLIGGAFSSHGVSTEFVVYSILLFLMHISYILWMLKYGRYIFARLFVTGRSTDWAIYAMGAVFSFFVLYVISLAPGSVWVTGTILIFIGWSFIVLCFAIINTHEKTKQKYEADIAREIISSGRGYYDKLTNVTENLHMMRHDYKYHLVSMQKLLGTGNAVEAREYLAKLNERTEDGAVYEYCNSRVLNALLDSFAERCKAESISFMAKIMLPDDTVDDYELCIILGNLLENAFTACKRTPDGMRRYIDLSMRPRSGNYGIKVENSYDGYLKHDGKELYSTKKDGGLGIRSIKSIASCHNGEYVPVWDEQKFSAFVVLKLEDE